MTDIIEEALKGYENAESCWSEIYQAAKDDLYFLSDEDGCQWSDRDFSLRKKKNRPALQIDQLTQFVNQVSNDVRMNTPTINIIPHSSGADVETAEIFQGLVKDIEQLSNADDAYDFSLNSAVKCSLGFIRIDHRYKDDESFEQELYIERIVNPFSVYLDPCSIAPDGSDAKCAWVLDEITIDEFKKRYPGKNPVSFKFKGLGFSQEKEEKITICEYFKIDERQIEIALLEDGTTLEYSDNVNAKSTRTISRPIVRRYHLSGEDVLEETTFPGKYVPLIPVYGEEAWRDGVRHIHSLIRKSKDSQRRYNYWASTEAELLMKSPKATIVAVGGTVENYAEDYKDPDKAIVLRYDQYDAKGNQAAAPQIINGPQIPSGIVNAMRQAAEDIKSTMGLYNSFLGQRSNETSGVAINQRKMEGDRAVFHFGDNLVRSITQVGRVLVSAIPEIYYEPRLVSIVGKEDESKQVGINGALGEGQERSFFLSQGQYNVRVTTGASFATMREEAANFFQQVIQSQPQLMEVAGDLLFKYMDFPGASVLSERMKKLISPELLDETQDPQVMALAQENEQLKQAIQQIQGEAQIIQQQLRDKQAEIQLKMQSEVADAQEAQGKQNIEIMKLQLEERKLELEYQSKQQEIALKERELVLKEQEALLNASGIYSEFPQEIPQSGGV